MKHTTAFILILALIISIGYYGINAADIFSGASHPETSRLPRNVQNYETVYISGEETGFNPMALTENSRTDNYYTYNTQKDSINITAALLFTISHYNTHCQFRPGESQKLISALDAKNGYIYTEKFQYTNILDETRYLDCILTSDFRIVYLRFYSDENDIKLSEEETTNALKEFDSYSNSFYYSAGISESYINNTLIDNGTYVDRTFDISCAETVFDNCCEFFLLSYKTIMEYVDTSDPVVSFWVPNAFLSAIELNKNEEYIYVTSVRHIFDQIMYTSGISEPEYTTYQGSIYQSIFFDQCELITIYNVRDKYIEGFYAPSYN